MTPTPTCVQCGESRRDIRRQGMTCGIMGPDTENGYGELEREWPRHRFKPYGPKELAAIARDEQARIDDMADFVEFVREREKQDPPPLDK